MTLRAVFFLALVAAPLPALAEAGLPSMYFCREASCACGAATCSCGQECDLSRQTCTTSQAGFCTHDNNCAASCNSFICEGNVCVVGMRTDGGGGTGYDAGAETMSPSTPQVSGCACDSTGAAGIAVLFALGLLGSLRRTTVHPERSRGAASRLRSR